MNTLKKGGVKHKTKLMVDTTISNSKISQIARMGEG
jgi:hypothetical protein